MQVADRQAATNICTQAVSDVTFCGCAALLEFGRPKRLNEP